MRSVRPTILKHVRASEFRICFADGATTALISDQVGDRVQVSFTRMDIIVTGETVQHLEDGRVQPVVGVAAQSENQKTVEFTVEMRPDVVVAVINSLLSGLRPISAVRKASYGLPATLPNDIPVTPPGTPVR
jgi:hypothetical protein